MDGHGDRVAVGIDVVARWMDGWWVAQAVQVDHVPRRDRSLRGAEHKIGTQLEGVLGVDEVEVVLRPVVPSPADVAVARAMEARADAVAAVAAANKLIVEAVSALENLGVGKADVRRLVGRQLGLNH